MREIEQNIDITVIVCCYNSANRLKSTLEHLNNQSITKSIIWDIIIVDNNSSDNTIELSIELWGKFSNNINLRVIKEPLQGLSNARKRGVESAHGDLIVFCDDDNWLSSSYLEVAYRFMKENPNVGVLGGKGIAVSSIDFPEWFTSHQECYAVGVQSIESGVINNRAFIWGSGMVIRRNELLLMYNSGFKSILSGRKGNNLSAGDDSEISKWFLLLGKDLYYNNQLSFKHFIEPKRLTVDYFKSLNNGFYLSNIIISQYDFIIYLLKKENKSIFKILNLFFILLFQKQKNKLKILLEFYNFTPFVFHKSTKAILKSRASMLNN